MLKSNFIIFLKNMKFEVLAAVIMMMTMMIVVVVVLGCDALKMTSRRILLENGRTDVFK